MSGRVHPAVLPHDRHDPPGLRSGAQVSAPSAPPGDVPATEPAAYEVVSIAHCGVFLRRLLAAAARR